MRKITSLILAVLCFLPIHNSHSASIFDSKNNSKTTSLKELKSIFSKQPRDHNTTHTHPPVQNPDGSQFLSDNDFVKNYNQYHKRNAIRNTDRNELSHDIEHYVKNDSAAKIYAKNSGWDDIDYIKPPKRTGVRDRVNKVLDSLDKIDAHAQKESGFSSHFNRAQKNSMEESNSHHSSTSNTEQSAQWGSKKDKATEHPVKLEAKKDIEAKKDKSAKETQPKAKSQPDAMKNRYRDLVKQSNMRQNIKSESNTTYMENQNSHGLDSMDFHPSNQSQRNTLFGHTKPILPWLKTNIGNKLGIRNKAKYTDEPVFTPNATNYQYEYDENVLDDYRLRFDMDLVEQQYTKESAGINHSMFSSNGKQNYWNANHENNGNGLFNTANIDINDNTVFDNTEDTDKIASGHINTVPNNDLLSETITISSDDSNYYVNKSRYKVRK